jgi:hypothetical protein
MTRQEALAVLLHQEIISISITEKGEITGIELDNGYGIACGCNRMLILAPADVIHSEFPEHDEEVFRGTEPTRAG